MAISFVWSLLQNIVLIIHRRLITHPQHENIMKILPHLFLSNLCSMILFCMYAQFLIDQPKRKTKTLLICYI